MSLLLIFVKNPVKGTVKTRIAKTAGDDEALRIYLELLKHTRNVTRQIEANRWIYYSTSIEDNDGWSIDEFSKKVQVIGDLGHKMQSAFEEGLKTYDKVVIIGSDCPLLTPEIINQAFESLNQHKVVFGPANDGGYYLLGMTEMVDSIFNNKPWSTPLLLDITCKELENQSISYALLEELPDVDHEEDWKKYGW
ncbi:MAG: TIGR04282 family arsenosugar biosynthesis glycosyltransferase [Bacteroidota bacterium]